MAILGEADHILLLGEERPYGLRPGLPLIDMQKTSIPQLQDYLTRKCTPRQKIAVLISPGMRIEDPGLCNSIIDTVYTHTLKQRSGDRTLINVAPRLGVNIINNLPRAAQHSWATKLDNPLRGVPAFIVGAGPSLDKNAHLLPEAAKRGVVFAVDMSAKAVRWSGAPVDVMVTLESQAGARKLMDLAMLFYDGKRWRYEPYPLLVADITSHPRNWSTWADRKLITTASDPAVQDVAMMCEAVPLAAASNVSGQAMCLAYYWGCDPIVVVGNDLAYTGGKFYATDSIWGTDEAKLGDDGAVHFGKKSGRGPATAVEVEAWGKKEGVITSLEYLSYRDYFANSAVKNARTEKRALYNCTEGGCHVPGWIELTLSDMLEQLPETEGERPVQELYRQVDALQPVSKEKVAEMHKMFYDGATRIIGAVAECWHPRTNKTPGERDMEMRNATREMLIMNAFCAARFVGLRNTKGLPPHERRRKYQEATMSAACDLRDLL